MKQSKALAMLKQWDDRGVCFFTSSELGMVFDEKGPTLRSTLRSLLRAGILERVAHNLYRYALSRQPSANLAEQIAVYLRRGHYCFESLESAAAKWGIVSQIPVDRITVMTTGREGEFHTRYGTIEFVHTSVGPGEIVANVVERPGNPLPIATKPFTLKNLKACHRSMHLIDWEEAEDA